VNNSLAISLVVAGILYGTPLVIAGLGELLSEKSGVMNLGIEGYMLMGAVSAFWVVTRMTGPSALVLTVAVIFAAVVGMLVALIYAFATVSIGADQLMCGLAIWIFAGATGFSSFVGSDANLGGIAANYSLQPLNVLGLGNVPILGPILFDQNALVYLSWVLVPVVWFYLNRTRTGLHLRAVGEEPASADAQGISVAQYQYCHVAVAGAMAGIAGSFYTLAISSAWLDGITTGAGWIALALVIFVFWRPELLLAGAYFFGALTGVGPNLQARGVTVPPEVFSVLPYLMTIAALVLASTVWTRTRHGAPNSLGLSYSREGH
jgi:general nucleoside transport system permease protein